ncbi:FHA domain-containing protein [Aquimonas voraii]|uniref:Forkhead associated (FHA) domain, binds pSer, pThr, pTyr n=1 Tax=Aquimonas voraii TaxID=265719 RepID=A0A1G6YC90_9GAMM|nr:FHA domain-containing protein [Aquimonas voraii]SDD87357.1 Forkhead associated (FHA) domain, binds pSer, pThr, pTyr [Aquimonas voraii]
MKLIFPKGEHGAVLLSPGGNTVGSAPDAFLRLVVDGMPAQLCELQLEGERLYLVAAPGVEGLSVNGQPADPRHSLRAGDLVGFGPVQARLVAVERVLPSASGRPAQVDDAGATRVRAALPKYLLRGVSGAAFGKTYAVVSTQVIGRHHECDISIPSEEISRRHAQVKPTADGLLVEDLGSSNGTFINGQQIQNGLLKNGDELRLDAIRFMLVVPGQEIPKAAVPAPEEAKGGSRTGLIFIAVTAVVAAAVAAAFLLR